MNKNCEMCGTPMGDVHKSRRFCTECSKIRQKEHEVRSKARKREGLDNIPVPCKFCGAPTTGDRRVHCPACPPTERRAENNSKPKAPEKPKKVRKKPLKGCWDLENKSPTHISVEADALGLSYGRYTSLVDTLFIERYLASEGITDGLERIDKAWKKFKKDKRDFERRLAARIEEEKRNEQELMEIEMGCFGEASLHPDNTFHCHY